jgi:hypothetical protein
MVASSNSRPTPTVEIEMAARAMSAASATRPDRVYTPSLALPSDRSTRRRTATVDATWVSWAVAASSPAEMLVPPSAAMPSMARWAAERASAVAGAIGASSQASVE